MLIESFIYGPAFSSISYSTNGSTYTEITTSRWYSFRDYVAAISSALPNGWSATYSEASDVVRFAPGSGSLSIRFSTTSQQDLMGFEVETTPLVSAAFTGTKAPGGICPLLGAGFSSPIPGKKPNLRTFRHGRAQSVAWGSGTRYSVNTMALYEHADRILGGPLSTGKVRIGPSGASAPYGPTNLGGYLDAYVIDEPTIEVFQGDVENHLELRMVVSAPAQAHDTNSQAKDAFWGQVERGYSLNFYALIEGVPFRFVEVDTGIADADRTVSATLIIDDSQKATHKVNRYEAISGASGATLGILDPLNELGIFDLPTFEVQISDAVEYDDTTITLAASTDALPSSGFVFLGNECLKYTGNTGSGGSPANQLTGITRPFGPGYAYGTQTVQKFKTVTDKKKAWSGSTVRLFAQLVDAYGRAVDTAWEGTYTRQVGAYQLQGLPGYDQGVWVLNCGDLIRRLNQPAVAAATAKISPFDFPDLFDPLQPQSADAAQVIVDNRNAVFRAIYEWTKTDSSEFSSGEFEIDMGDIGSPPRFSSYAESLAYALNVMNGQAVPDLLWLGSQVNIQSVSHLAVDSAGFRFLDDGTVVAKVVTTYGVFASNPPDLTGQLIFSPIDGQPAPSWLPQSTVVAQFFKNTDEVELDVITGLSGATHDLVVIDQPANNPGAVGSFPSSGMAIIRSDGDTDGQLVSYDSTQTLGERLILQNLVRLEGGPQSVFKNGGEVSQAVLLEGHAGNLIAQIVESSGFDTGARGTFDLMPSGFGYALEAAEFVNDATTGADVETSINGGPSVIQNLRLALTKGNSLQDLFSGILSSYGLALAWVRSGVYLKLGAVGTITTGQAVQYTITDSDLVAGSAGDIRQIGDSPNVVKVTQQTSMLGKGGASYTYRIIEDIQARGVSEITLSLWGLDSSSFVTIAEQAAARFADGSFAQTAYSLKVTGDRDYLAGQLVGFDITYPGLWDFQEQRPGLSGTGRILEVSRNLTTNQVDLVVLVSGPSKFGTLCPVAYVTGYNPSGPTITVTDPTIFQEGDGIRVELPGVNNGSNHSTFMETTVDGISGNDITLGAALTFTPNTYTVATYPQDDAADITEDQAVFVHINDGSRYA